MSEQVHAHAPQRHDEVEGTVADTGQASREEAAKKLAETDALLDEIDAVLADQGIDSEAEAQDFVANYRQRGGE